MSRQIGFFCWGLRLRDERELDSGGLVDFCEILTAESVIVSKVSNSFQLQSVEIMFRWYVVQLWLGGS